MLVEVGMIEFLDYLSQPAGYLSFATKQKITSAGGISLFGIIQDNTE